MSYIENKNTENTCILQVFFVIIIVNKLTNIFTVKIMKNNNFGKYLNKCRGNVSLQQLANFCGCTKSYLWDIEQGNTKPPQNYKRLNDIANALNLTGVERNKLFDLAKAEGDIPVDVKMIINKNPELIEKIRNNYKEL